MHLRAITDFSWAHRGCEIVQYAAGQVFKTDDEDLRRVACADGWAEVVESPDDGQEAEQGPSDDVAEKADRPASNKAHTGAPENK